VFMGVRLRSDAAYLWAAHCENCCSSIMSWRGTGWSRHADSGKGVVRFLRYYADISIIYTTAYNARRLVSTSV
jgi:hypothetical protein